MKTRKHPEQIFQRGVADFLKLALPFPDAWFTTIPAGGGGKTRGAILKGMGYKAGTPDMLVIWKPRHWKADEGSFAIWLELKSVGGKLSKAQKQCRDALVAAGCYWALCRSLEDVEKALRRFGVPLRTTVGAVLGEAA